MNLLAQEMLRPIKTGSEQIFRRFIFPSSSCAGSGLF